MRRYIRPRNLTAALAATAAVALLVHLRAAEGTARNERSRKPSRILLTLQADPARSQAVTWRTEAALEQPRAELARLSGDPEIRPEMTVAAAAHAVALPQEGKAWHYEAKFEGLRPATRYVYRVGGGASWSEWLSFQTAAEQPQPFRFLYFGDAQNDLHSRWSRVVRLAWATAPDARFMVHAGDLLEYSQADRLWGEWCEALGFMGGMIPSLPAVGNHDREPDSPRAALGWRRHFSPPRNGPAQLAGDAFFVDYQGVRFLSVALNALTSRWETNAEAQAMAQAQIEWLERTLRENPNRWTIVVQHQPAYSVARNRRTYELEKRLVPLYDRHGVDLVLQGHDHAYARSHKLRGGMPVGMDEPGTVYVVSVSGPKMYDLTPERPELLARSEVKQQMFQVISVEGGRLRYEAHSAAGVLVDRFQLEKTSVHRARRLSLDSAGYR